MVIISPAFKFCTDIEVIARKKRDFHKTPASTLFYVSEYKEQVTVNIIRPVITI